jgi:hypothetical protein
LANWPLAILPFPLSILGYIGWAINLGLNAVRIFKQKIFFDASEHDLNRLLLHS